MGVTVVEHIPALITELQLVEVEGMEMLLLEVQQQVLVLAEVEVADILHRVVMDTVNVVEAVAVMAEEQNVAVSMNIFLLDMEVEVHGVMLEVREYV